MFCFPINFLVAQTRVHYFGLFHIAAQIRLDQIYGSSGVQEKPDLFYATWLQ